MANNYKYFDILLPDGVWHTVESIDTRTEPGKFFAVEKYVIDRDSRRHVRPHRDDGSGNVFTLIGPTSSILATRVPMRIEPWAHTSDEELAALDTETSASGPESAR